MKLKQRGFTLIELMITVAILSIIAAVSYPSYREHINKSKQAEATAALYSFANAMEMYRMQNNSYTGATTAIFSAVVPLSGGTKTYDLSIATTPALTATSYTLVATPVDTSQATLTLTSTGVKSW